MSWHYLQELAGDCSRPNFSAGAPSRRSKSTRTAARCYCDDSSTACWACALSGMTSVPLTVHLGVVSWMSSLQDSRASRSVARANAPAPTTLANMWPETARVIREVRPRFAFLENVPGLLSGAHGYFGHILGELAELGSSHRLGGTDVGPDHGDGPVKCPNPNCGAEMEQIIRGNSADDLFMCSAADGCRLGDGTDLSAYAISCMTAYRRLSGTHLRDMVSLVGALPVGYGKIVQLLRDLDHELRAMECHVGRESVVIVRDTTGFSHYSYNGAPLPKSMDATDALDAMGSSTETDR